MEKHLTDIKNQKQSTKDYVATKDAYLNNKKDVNNSYSNSMYGEDKIDDKNMLSYLENKMKEMETEYDTEENIVLDLGSAYTKVGVSGDYLPRLSVPSIYSVLNLDNNIDGFVNNHEKDQHIFGYDYYKENRSKDDYKTKYLNPGDHENIIDSEFKDLIQYALNKIGISNFSDYNVIVNSSPIKNKKNINSLIKILIEEIGFKGISIINSSSLSLFASGRTTGLVVDCGETNTMSVPVFEGFPLYHALNTLNLGGKNITDMFLKGILEAKQDFNIQNIRVIREIKNKMACVPYKHDYSFYLNNDKEDVISPEKKLYKNKITLPDDTNIENEIDDDIIEVPKEFRIKAGELLFTPSIIGSEEKGLLNLLSDSIKKTVIDNEEIKNKMFNNIVLTGGTSMMNGFNFRINKYLPDLIKTEDVNAKLNIVADTLRYNSTWIGASMIASMSTFNKLLITKEMWADSGEEKINIYKKIF